jgi:hypothetical protein
VRILTVPGLPLDPGGDMSAPVRDEAAVAGELDSLRRLNADASDQLARTRATMEIKQQEIGELELHEYNLLVAIDGRSGKIDRLLDEMLTMRTTGDAT